MSANQVSDKKAQAKLRTDRGLSLAQTNKVGPPERMESERRSSQHSPRVLGRSIRITAVNRVCRFYFPLIHVVFRAFGVPRGAAAVFASTIDLCRRLPRQRRVGPPRNPVCARGMGNLRRSRSFAELLLVGRRATSRM